VPLLVLFELSILLAAAFGRPASADADPDVADRLASAEGS
jgi:Sec-independent protein secretion pathway component TatC